MQGKSFYFKLKFLVENLKNYIVRNLIKVTHDLVIID